MVNFTFPRHRSIQFWLHSPVIGVPTKPDAGVGDARLFPSECRERGATYAAPFSAIVSRRVNGGAVEDFPLKLGEIPIMVRSSHCHTHGLSPKQLVERGEEAVEFGGYFICNGIERIIRMLQIPKRNYPMAITRGAYTNRGPLYSNRGVVIRSVRPDFSAITLTLHYLTDGSATVRFAVKRQEFFLPVVLVLKALVPTTDREIYERVLAGDAGNTHLSDRLLMLLRDAKRYAGALHSRDSALAFIGARFRAVLDMAPSLTDIAAGRALLDRYVLVHLPPDALRDKFQLLVLMLRKLYAFVRGDVLEDNADSLANHELLVSGHFVQMFIKEKLAELLTGVQTTLEIQDRLAERAAALGGGGKSARAGTGPVDAHDGTAFRKVLDRQPDVGRKLYYLLATGNLVSSSGLDLMQASGFTVVADKINFIRFTTHFRSVHRGAFFSTMKTTTVRKLLPENWGFLCPVHTPDGGPCGLLNHLSAPANVVAYPLSDADYGAAVRRAARGDSAAAAASGDDDSDDPIPFAAALPTALIALGMVPHVALGTIMPATHLPIMLDGRLLGGATPHVAYRISRALRYAKALTGGVAAGLERFDGRPPQPGQAAAVADLVRAACLGLTDSSSHAAREARKRRGGYGSSLSATTLPGLGALDPNSLVPPSMEVAFIPPPWWDADVDPDLAASGNGIADANARARRLSGYEQVCEDGGVPVPLVAASAAAALPPPGALAAALAARDGTTGPAAPVTRLVGLFPGLFLHTTPARLLRPVLQLDTGLVELVCPCEQPYLDIAVTPEDVRDILLVSQKRNAEAAAANASPRVLYTHIELSPAAMLSETASLTPFSDLNQSPRNMYQCQMAKQTMGTPVHGWPRRADNKLFRLQHVQAPLVQNASQGLYGYDEYPNGANAVVAVIAYTGYDMEDACIIGKSSYERGFGHASVYKTYVLDLQKDRPASDAFRYSFDNTYKRDEAPLPQPRRGNADPDAPDSAAVLATSRPSAGDRVAAALDLDGLPPIGYRLRTNEPFYCVFDAVAGKHVVTVHKDAEEAVVDEVRVLATETAAPAGSGSSSGDALVQRVSIKLRINRNPIVGDKFSSRHGQKGVLSYLWPTSDMPFTDDGLTPDVIINPHAFPSRMTIGMLVESMAGKAGALSGEFVDSSPFRFDETNRVVDHVGERLRSAGYAYFGTETMYSGVTGEPLPADIYLGVVYYQRLRHMVADKAQARAMGKVNSLTRQPVKGRKKHGGIRFGEMERDSLLAHGAAFLLHDRLMNCSDRHVALVCRGCGSFLSPISRSAGASEASLPGDNNVKGTRGFRPIAVASTADGAGRVDRTRRAPVCLACGHGDDVVPVPVPYVFRYLANELAAMNIKIVLELGER